MRDKRKFLLPEVRLALLAPRCAAGLFIEPGRQVNTHEVRPRLERAANGDLDAPLWVIDGAGRDAGPRPVGVALKAL